MYETGGPLFMHPEKRPIMADTTVYTLPDCQPCKATKRLFEKLGVPYIEVSLLDDPDAAQRFRERGLMEAPVVETFETCWSGFKDYLIKEHYQNLIADGKLP